MADKFTTAQKQALKAAINADSTLATQAAASDFESVANALNLPSSPAFIVWRTSVTRKEILRDPAYDWTRVDNLSVGKARIWDSMFIDGPIDASQANIRAGVAAVWVGTSADLAVQAAVLQKCKRTAFRVEKVLATGTGSDATPGLLTFEGSVTVFDIGPIMQS